MEQKYKPYVMYKITCNDNENLIYIGSTTNFRVRKTLHKSRCHNENYKLYNSKIYENMRNNGGWTNFTMKPIEMYYSDSKIKAKIRENELMKELNCNLNTYNAFTSNMEKKEKNIYRSKEHYKKNKEMLDKKNKEYGEKHKDEILNKRKEAIITCECGCETRKDNVKRHLTSKKHQQFIANSL